MAQLRKLVPPSYNETRYNVGMFLSISHRRKRKFMKDKKVIERKLFKKLKSGQKPGWEFEKSLKINLRYFYETYTP